MTKESKETVPLKMHATHDSIVDMTDEFCQSHLTDEYAELCRKLAAQLTRKRPSPLERGRPKSWTGAILYTIARVNFLFDPNQTPHMSASQLCELVGVSQCQVDSNHGYAGHHPYAPEWTLPSQLDENPLAWMIQVNGLIIDAPHTPREIQEQAFQLGLIPYIPGA